MADKEIIKALECCLDESLEKCNECPYSVDTFPYSVDTFMCKRMEFIEDILDLINRQQELLEATIAGQKTLQKALAEKNAEIERRKNNLFCKVVIDEEEMRNIVNKKVAEFELDIESIKAEAIREFAERLKEALPMECRTVVEGNDMQGITDTGFQKDDTMTTIDNLVKEMAGDTE